MVWSPLQDIFHCTRRFVDFDICNIPHFLLNTIRIEPRKIFVDRIEIQIRWAG